VNFAESLGWPAPAKLNLMLRIVGRRADGLHELQTVFRFLDWGDELEFRPRNDARVELTGAPEAIADGENLCVRAAQALRERTGAKHGVEIQLRKRLPMGAGLGGGSSDAATVLVALNQLWGLGLTSTELAEIGLGLGADVPVFLFGHAAWGEGVGERLQSVQLPEAWYLVLWPRIAVSTAAVFQDPELTRNSPRITIRDLAQHRGDNDCLAVVRARYPRVAQALQAVSAVAPAYLTGTGACVYAEFASRDAAEAASRALDGGDWDLWVARGLNQSPLSRRLFLESPGPA
jgi:4-diphosphocytidyl-2-C-methyl-D-erythritol kinase